MYGCEGGKSGVIQFPVIRRVDVKNYELFHTGRSEGISHSFGKGVHAIVGINGLGKTTLLTMLYRGLLGPYDQNKSDDAGLLGSQHELTKWRTKSFFRERVSDGASDASVELDVSFGGDLLTVRRALSDLHVEFRHYAENASRNNVLIASTNLNNEEMLSALLGSKRLPKRDKTASSQLRLGRARAVDETAAPTVPKSERPSRIVNLLDLAAPSAALRQYRSHYRRLFNQALGR
jgi:hypothetical protein